MFLLNIQFTTEEANRILLDDLDSDEEDFEELNIANTDADNALGGYMEEDQSEDQISDHDNNDDQGKLLQITFTIYMRVLILHFSICYLEPSNLLTDVVTSRDGTAWTL